MSDPVFITEVFSSIQGEGFLAGRRQIFIRLADCNLDCRYCDTDYSRQDTCRVEMRPGSATFNHLPQPLSPQELVGLIIRWNESLPGAHHSISITGGEPLMHAEALTLLLPGLRSILPIHLETNGTMPDALKRVIPYLNYISMDMKLPSTSGCDQHLWGLHQSFLESSIGHAVSIKVVIAENTGLDEIYRVCDIINQSGPSIPLFLQPVTLSTGDPGITPARILLLQEAASSVLGDVRVIPQMHRMLGAL